MKRIFWIAFVIMGLSLNLNNVHACSTFKLQHGDRLLYGHNLNQGDMGVPGMVFINKRGIFKIGRTWTELATVDHHDPSGYTWISRYGSVTFNTFGRDLPDGGMNESGLFIWEMNDNPTYPQNTGLPKLNQMNWMQYILDMCSTTEEAVQCAFDFEVEGWGWHYFIGDASGKTAAINFVDGHPVVHTGDHMPVPGLFNTPYDRELELLKYYQGFGGLYPIDLNDPEVTRFAKVARMTREYKPGKDFIQDGFKILNQIKVYDEPEWSIIMDVSNMAVYFKTRVNPEIKSFLMSEVDFSNSGPTMMVDMDIEKGGQMFELFSPISNERIKDFFQRSFIDKIPEEMITRGGITKAEWIDRFASHTDAALNPESQFFAGTWRDVDKKLSIILVADSAKVTGFTSNGKDRYPLEHFSLDGNHLTCTFKTKTHKLIEMEAIIEDQQMDFGYRDTSKNPATKMTLIKQDLM